ncbi:MAG: polysaccharide deacetylase family protein [Meiothermus sp.]|uniref:polysaccharide deacetylase family protein n=1 Tax=Meiothermus sp. TaxID=1955249 RepID=UPI00298F29BE|nr:polysaccharide deacetylase family protein [Meiothermus sp.]MDW8425828.1 polysaccharide deacetylase family protein [Meiothermus sp.]
MNPYRFPLSAIRTALFQGHQIACSFRKPPAKRTVVLNYHSVRPKNLFFNSTSTEVFERHLEWIAEHCEVVDFTQVLHDNSAVKPRVSIVFDDGFLDNLEYAVPLLKKYSLKATFFISTGFLVRDPVILDIFARTFQATSEDFLDKDALQELYLSGMGIGAHTHSHRNLLSLPPFEQREELFRSKEMLEDLLGCSVPTLAYPFGVPGKAFDLTTCRIAEEVGFLYAGSVCWRGVLEGDSSLRVPRFTVVNESVAELGAIVHGALDPIGFFQEWRFSGRRTSVRKPQLLALSLVELSGGLSSSPAFFGLL